MKIHLQRASVDDVIFVRDCAHASYSMYVERIGREPAPMVADFENQISEGAVDLVMRGSVPVGFAFSYQLGDHLFVENVALLPAHQGGGLGRALFARLEERAVASGQRAVELYTNEKMVENIGLYGHIGYEETGRRNQDGFNRVYFRKALT